ncbi:MAG TPA: type II toxin-antitoxin system CcdA family antitoxin [Allosphingosinicella sp.]|jgi:antitoxin CcdA
MRNAAHADPEKAARKPTNLSLDAHLVDQARQLGINLSRACEQGLAARIAEEQARRWRADNAEAIAASNRFVEKKGLPLGALRRF